MNIQVNGKFYTLKTPNHPLLWSIRDEVKDQTLKYGCGVGFCGACTVLIDGVVTKSCQTKATKVQGQSIETLATKDQAILSAVQQAWYDLNVVQCGYCQSGQILAAVGYLNQNPEPTDQGIDDAMSENVCRCGTYHRIRKAIYLASDYIKNKTPTGTWSAPMTEANDLKPNTSTDPCFPFIDFNADGTTLLRCSQLEKGQGAFTTLATLVAEELDLDLHQIKVVHAANDPALYINTVMGNATQLTGGSSSTRLYMARYVDIAGGLRMRLLSAGALQLNVPVTQLTTVLGHVVDTVSGQKIPYFDLREAVLAQPMPTTITRKSPENYTLVGNKDIKRLDGSAKITGTAKYILDLDWEGMKILTVLNPNQFGATLKSFDREKVMAHEGIIDVMDVDGSMAVIAEVFFDAIMPTFVVPVVWDTTNALQKSTADILADHYAKLDSTDPIQVALKKGELLDTAPSLEASYDIGYQSHMPMEPANAACRMREDGVLEVWIGHQVPQSVINEVQAITGLPLEKIDVQMPYVGGAFGLKAGDHPFVLGQLLKVAKAINYAYPLKLQSTRNDDVKHGNFRPMAVVRLQGWLDGQQQLTGLAHRAVMQSINDLNIESIRVAASPNGIDMFSVHGAVEIPYSTVPNYQVELIEYESIIPVLSYRSVSATANEFARESFIDELALQAKTDPADFRKAMLKDNPRALAVLEKVLEMSDWYTPLPKGQARGLAISASFASFSAQVVEIAQNAKQEISIQRIYFAVDAGRAISPDTVQAQIEGGITYAMGEALWSELVIDKGVIKTVTFDTYEIPRMRDTPDLQVVVMESTEKSGGLGEVAGPTVAAAIGNAIARLTSQRLRSLPFSKVVKFAPVIRGDVTAFLASDANTAS